ncbi:membrane-spanning 4-domains subfamily A member 15-like [Megalops cyprinoides]|uniref:membrane-spanning 4-domains subfamily A member 15-like n=1 Tax=Megalops cyprinoides TaxID=118141 RepID=UPI0018650CF5|nr:membrane-spanning 4-domains subfamily A member 15-like [Megalops cyprinoides]
MVPSTERNDGLVARQKPLHRFIKGEPQCIGIAVLFFGCGELLIGLQLFKDDSVNSATLYIPFWLGALFLISGSLSIYTENHPSKKMVTVCLSMYVVSLLGVFISLCYRVHCFIHIELYLIDVDDWTRWRYGQVMNTEAVLLAASLCC